MNSKRDKSQRSRSGKFFPSFNRPLSGFRGRTLIAIIAVAVAAFLGLIGCTIAVASANAKMAPATASVTEPTPTYTATLDCQTHKVSGTVGVNGVKQANGSFYQGELDLWRGNTSLDFQFTNAHGDASFTYSFTPAAGTTSTGLELRTPTGTIDIKFTVSWDACAPANQPPVAKLSVTPNSGNAPLAVTANGSQSMDDHKVVSYDFAWGDGTSTGTQTGATATHTYTTAGSYTVTETVKDAQGLSDTATQSVTVNKVTPPTCQSGTTGITGTAVYNKATDKSTYSVTIPMPACADISIPADTYLLTSTNPVYTGGGFGAPGSYPQHWIQMARTDLVIKMGTTTITATVTVGAPCGGNVQPDVYQGNPLGKHQDDIGQSGSNGYIEGSIFSTSACVAVHKDASASLKLTGVCGLNNDSYQSKAVYATLVSIKWDHGVLIGTYKSYKGHVFSNGQPTLTLKKNEVNTSVSCTKPVTPTHPVGPGKVNPPGQVVTGNSAQPGTNWTALSIAALLAGLALGAGLITLRRRSDA